MPEQFLHGVEVVEIDDGPRPIRTVKSSIIGLVGTAPRGPVNTPVLIAGSLSEAVTQFGDVGGGFSIPEALNGIFDQTGAMVVVINVADPANAGHITAVPAANVPFTAGDIIDLGHRTVSAVSVKSTDGETTYVAGTDYDVDAYTGIITRRLTGTIEAAATVKVAYSYLDASKVTTSDVIGGVDEATGAYEGVYGLLAAQSVVKVQPRILCAPRFTHQRPVDDEMVLANPVVAELLGIANRLRAVIIADGPNTNDADAIDYREDFGSARLFVVDPWVKVWDTATDSAMDQPASARVAGMIARSDNERGFWWSPSNLEMYGIVGTSRAVDFVLGDTNCRANYLNENEVATIIQEDGYRLWGNRTCSSDPKWAFLSVRRTADMINDSIMRGHMWAVDRSITKTYIKDVTEGVNDYLRSLKVQGALINGSCWADPELNTPDQISQGKVYFDFDFTPPYPAEHITFRSRMVNDYLEELFA